MLESLTNAWSAVKGGAVDAGAKAYLNSKIGRFGSVTQFNLNSKARTIFIEVQLRGEVSPVSINIGAYEVIRREGATFVSVHDVHASREWIGLAVDQYVAGQQFK